MEQKLSTTSPKQQVLCVAAINDIQATELVTALDALGVNALLTYSVDVAAQVDEEAVCLVILHPGQWRGTPAIMAAIRCKPRYLVPILSEPMPLPDSIWATTPIYIKEPLSETANELVPLIHSYMKAFAEQANVKSQPTPSAETSWPRTSAWQRLGRRRTRIHISYPSIFRTLLVVLGLGILVYLLPHAPRPFRTAVNTTQGTSTIQNQPYTAIVPGPGCDTHGAQWNIGQYYKSSSTATASPRPNTTPTLQVVSDNSTVTTCQPDGLLVKHNDHFATYASIFFDNQGTPLPYHFSTHITATFISASNAASISLGVRNQENNSSTDDNGYGDDTLEIGPDGSWTTNRYNDITDGIDATFTKGFLKPARTFTLGAEVNGPQMTFSINGRKVTTIVDTTYPNGYSIGFGIGDPEAKSPPSALFSHFAYMPLPDKNLPTYEALATATAQATQDEHTPYTATVPGFGCDSGKGQWQPPSEGQNFVTTRCQSNGLLMSQKTGAKYLGSASFYGLDGQFPANYTVKVHIDTSQLTNGCAGLSTRTDEQGGGYAYFICADGFWQMRRYDDGAGDGHQLAEGDIPQNSSYTMEVMARGSTQSLVLNGAQVSSVNDKTYTTTDHIELLILAGDQGGTAMFSNFGFAPLL